MDGVSPKRLKFDNGDSTNNNKEDIIKLIESLCNCPKVNIDTSSDSDSYSGQLDEDTLVNCFGDYGRRYLFIDCWVQTTLKYIGKTHVKDLDILYGDRKNEQEKCIHGKELCNQLPFDVSKFFESENDASVRNILEVFLVDPPRSITEIVAVLEYLKQRITNGIENVCDNEEDCRYLLKVLLKVLAGTETDSIKIKTLEVLMEIIQKSGKTTFWEGTLPLIVHFLFINLSVLSYDVLKRAKHAIQTIIKLKLADKRLLLEYLSILIVKIMPKTCVLSGKLGSIFKNFCQTYTKEIVPSDIEKLTEPLLSLYNNSLSMEDGADLTQEVLGCISAILQQTDGTQFKKTIRCIPSNEKPYLYLL